MLQFEQRANGASVAKTKVTDKLNILTAALGVNQTHGLPEWDGMP